MTHYESAITERLHDAAGRIPVDTSPSHLAELVPTAVARRAPNRRRTLIAGVAVAASVAAVIVAVGVATDPATVEVGPADTAGPVDEVPTPPAPAPDSERPPPAPAAHVAAPPAWFGEPQGAVRDGGFRTGRWATMAIGRVADGVVSEPILVSVFDGTYQALDDAEAVTIDGMSLRSARFGSWQVLAIDGTPTVVVSGDVAQRTLAAVLAAVEVVDPTGELSLRLQSIPEGYAEIAAPRVLGPDVALRRTLASESGGVRGTVISEVSDWTDPLLGAAASGSDLTAVDLDGNTGWVGTATGNPVGPLRFLVWSPRPGVVFEISTGDTERTTSDLVDLALATSVLEADDWDALYG
jgi:hypothetical protein